MARDGRSERAPRAALALLGTALAVGALGVSVVGCPGESSLGNPANVATSGAALTAAEVDQILLRAVNEARARGQTGAIAVVDREGEVLGVYTLAQTDSNGDGRVEVTTEANVVAAISKAATAAAFQSEGEAFTTRTAFFIVQGNYPPAVRFTPGGPLFGVQDSGMPGGDAHIVAYDQNGAAVGAGISGELGGVPIYKQGSPVGGIGVDTVSPTQDLGGAGVGIAPTLVVPIQVDVDEQIARAGIGVEFETPLTIQSTNVFVDGQAFPFYGGGTSPGPVATTPTTLAGLAPSVGAIDARFPVRASPLAPEVRVGADYGIRGTHRFLGRVGARFSSTFTGTLSLIDRPASVTLDANLRFSGVPIVPLAQRTTGGGEGEDRAPAIDSIEPPPAEGGLTAAEVRQIVDLSVGQARSAVAGIRLPRGSHVTVHVTVVDRRGNLLTLYRMGDGTLFSSDIAVQKARTCAFFSTDGTEGLPAVAFSARAIGFLSQPYFPPGIDGNRPGPLARLRTVINRGKIEQENPPSNRLVSPPPRLPSDGTTDEDPTTPGGQGFDDYPGVAPTALAAIRTILGNAGGICLFADRTDTTPDFVSPGLQSGMMTFPGAVPLYRNGRLIGAIGVSGDGVDEDDAASQAGAINFPPPIGSRCDEQSVASVSAVLRAKVEQLTNAILAHPDLRIRAVYGPVMIAERDKLIAELNANTLANVRLPYIKLPRNPNSF